MSRDARIRQGFGEALLNAPRINNLQDVQTAIDDLYTEVNNILRRAVSKSNASTSQANEGEDGDIRLYKDSAEDGSTGYFIQGKFGDTWATARLSLETIDVSDTGNSSFGDESFDLDNPEDVGREWVTYENLVYNQDVGEDSDQVAKGDHNHDHSNLLNAAGFKTHSVIDDHIDDLSIHREPGDINVTESTVVDPNTTASPGTATTWARSDHMHRLDISKAYSFTNRLEVTKNSDDVNAVNISNNSTSQYALNVTGRTKITGDTTIIGDLSVDFAAAGGGDADVDGDFSADEDVSLNEHTGSSTDTYTTTIFGKTYQKNLVQILKQLAGGQEGQLELQHDASNKAFLGVDSGGSLDIKATGNLILSPDYDESTSSEAVLPKTDSIVDLGAANKKFKTLFVSEIYAETFVAQEVLATTGGRIMVAPTARLTADINDAVTSITVDNNNLANNDWAIMRSSAIVTGSGLPVQMEVFQITSAYTDNGDGTYTYSVTRNVDGSGANPWIEGDAIVNIGYAVGDGHIELTATQTLLGSVGPSISIHARKTEGVSWDNSTEVVRIGNIDNIASVSDTRYGAAFGENLDRPANTSVNPFKGMIVDNVNGMQLLNAPFKLYDGSSLSAFIGKDSEGFDVMALGNGLSSSATSSGEPDSWDNAKLLFKKASSSGAYTLNITGALNIENPESWPFYDSADDVLNAIDWFLPNTSNPGSNGFYVTNEWMGFYKALTGGDTVAWPIKIGAAGSDPFCYIGSEDESSYLKYTTSEGLVVKGSILADSELSVYLPYYTEGLSDGSGPDIAEIMTLWGTNTADDGDVWKFTTRFDMASAFKASEIKLTLRIKDVNTSGTKIVWFFPGTGTQGLLLDDNVALTADGGTALKEYIVKIDESSQYFDFMTLDGGNFLAHHTSMSAGDPVLFNNVNDDQGLQLIWNSTDDPDDISVTHITSQVKVSSIINQQALEDINNDVLINDGSITIGNIADNSIHTYQKDSFTDDTEGVWMGMYNNSGLKGAINIGSANSYLKYDGVKVSIKLDATNTILMDTNVADQGSSVNTGVIVGSWAEQSSENSYFNAEAGSGILVKAGVDNHVSISEEGIKIRNYGIPILVYDGTHVGCPTRYKSDAMNTTYRMEQEVWQQTNSCPDYGEGTQNWAGGLHDIEEGGIGYNIHDHWQTDGYDVFRDIGDTQNRTGAFKMRGAFYTMAQGATKLSPWYSGACDGDEGGLCPPPYVGLPADGDNYTPMFTDEYWGTRDYYHKRESVYTTQGGATAPTFGAGSNFFYEEPDDNTDDKRFGGIRNAYAISGSCLYFGDQARAMHGSYYSDDGVGNEWPPALQTWHKDVAGAHIGYFLCRSFGAGGNYYDVVPEGKKLLIEISGERDDDTGWIPYNGFATTIDSDWFGQFYWGAMGSIFGFGIFKNQKSYGSQIMGMYQSMYGGFVEHWQKDQMMYLECLFSTKKKSAGTDNNAYNFDGTAGVAQGESYADWYCGWFDDFAYRTANNCTHYGANLTPMYIGGRRYGDHVSNVSVSGTWSTGITIRTGVSSVGDTMYPVIESFRNNLEYNNYTYSAEIPSGTDLTTLHYFGIGCMDWGYQSLLLGLGKVSRIKLWEIDDTV